MNISFILAEFWGIVLVVCCISLLVNKQLYNNIAKAAQKEEFLFLYSLFVLIIGAVGVSFYNVWSLNYEGLITLFAWSALLKGVFGLVFPKTSIVLIDRFKVKSSLIYGFLVLFLLLGVYLLYVGLIH